MASARLLLVDDEPHLALIVNRIARMADLDFASRADAQSAQEFLKQNVPDLILLDVNLPGMSGVELLRQLRGTSATAGLKVALFCQLGLTGDIAAGWAAGADYLVSKDLIGQPELLRQRIVTILAHTHGQSPMRLLTCPAYAPGQTSQDWSALLNNVLAESAARELGSEVLEQLLRRAVERAFSTEDRSAWVIPGLGRLDRRSLPLAVERSALGICFFSLAEQLWCLLGPERSGTLVASLQVALDRVFASNR